MTEVTDSRGRVFTGIIRDYRDENGVGYLIQHHPEDGYRWIWAERGWPFEADVQWCRKLSHALDLAAGDWEYNGSPGFGDRRGATLKRAATIQRKKEESGE